MSGKAFDREIVYETEMPSSGTFNRMYGQFDRTCRDMLMAMLARSGSIDGSSFVSTPASVYVGSGLKVKPKTGMTVSVTKGFGFQYQGAGAVSDILSPTLAQDLDDLSLFKPLVLDADLDINITASHGSFPRWDLIEVKAGYRVTDATGVYFVTNTSPPTISGQTVSKSLSFVPTSGAGAAGASTHGISYVAGTPASPAVKPAVTSGYEVLAWVYVPALAATVTEGLILDYRNVAHTVNEVVIRVRRLAAKAGFATSGSAGLRFRVLGPPGIVVRAMDRIASSGNDEFDIVICAPIENGVPASRFSVSTVNASYTGVPPVGEMLDAHVTYSSVAIDAIKVDLADAAFAPTGVTPFDYSAVSSTGDQIAVHRVNVRRLLLTAPDNVSIDDSPSADYQVVIRIPVF